MKLIITAVAVTKRWNHIYMVTNGKSTDYFSLEYTQDIDLRNLEFSQKLAEFFGCEVNLLYPFYKERVGIREYQRQRHTMEEVQEIIKKHYLSLNQ